jgi:hypothetical protein
MISRVVPAAKLHRRVVAGDSNDGFSTAILRLLGRERR